jgi:hypothetical protein
MLEKNLLAWHHDGMMTVNTWWLMLCAVGTLNVAAWAVSAHLLRRRQTLLPPEVYRTRRLLMLLSAVYVFGCAYRCFFLVYDVPRICLIDTAFSSVLVGRSVATLAELCFVAQWALLLREQSRTTGSMVGKVVSRAVVPLIAIAETCSWYSVLTTSRTPPGARGLVLRRCRLRRVHVLGRCTHVLDAMACGRGLRTPLHDPR